MNRLLAWFTFLSAIGGLCAIEFAHRQKIKTDLDRANAEERQFMEMMANANDITRKLEALQPMDDLVPQAHSLFNIATEIRDQMRKASGTLTSSMLQSYCIMQRYQTDLCRLIVNTPSVGS